MTASANIFDVAVVGAGPAGAMAALTLARGGARVVLLDRARFPRPKICGQFLTPKSVAALRESGFQPGTGGWGGWRVDSLLFTDGGRELRAPFPAGLEGVAVTRTRMDHALVEASCEAGASLLEEVEVADYRRDAEGWRLGLKRGDAGESELLASHLVAADGRLSRFGGIRRPRRGAPHGDFVGVQAEYEGVRAIGSSVELHLLPAADREGFLGYAGFVGLGGTRANLCPVFRRDLLRRLGGPEAALDWAVLHIEHLRERFGAARRREPVLVSPCVETRHGTPAGPGGLLRAGDAAGYLEPFTGEGMSMAIRSGRRAAECLLRALARECGADAAAAEYAAWHRRVFGRLSGWNAALRLAMRSPGGRRLVFAAASGLPPLRALLIRTVLNAGRI